MLLTITIVKHFDLPFPTHLYIFDIYFNNHFTENAQRKKPHIYTINVPNGYLLHQWLCAKLYK